jgi:hypothetical protein
MAGMVHSTPFASILPQLGKFLSFFPVQLDNRLRFKVPWFIKIFQLANYLQVNRGAVNIQVTGCGIAQRSLHASRRQHRVSLRTGLAALQ